MTENEARHSLRASPYRDRRKSIVAVALASMASGLFETVTIVTIVAFIEGVTSGKLRWEISLGPLSFSLDRTDLTLVATLALLAMTATQICSTWLKARAGAYWQYKLQTRAMGAYMSASWPVQSNESAGSLQNLMQLCASTKQGLLGVMTLLTAVGPVLVFSAAAFIASPIAAGALVATGAALLLALRPIRTATREATRTAAIEQRVVSEEVGEIHDLAQEIRVNHASEAVERRFDRANRRWRRSRQRAALIAGVGGVVYRSLGLGFVLVATVIASSQTDIDIARVGVAGLLLLRSLSYGQNIQNAWQTIESTRPYIEQAGEALEKYERSTARRGEVRMNSLGDLELIDLSYSYDGDTPALDKLSLTIGKGETLGVVGPSGGGKSTLAQVLLGLREPTAGRYLAGETPVPEIAAEDWFQLVTVVPQQPQILQGTVLENIVFYRDWIDEDRARSAATASGLHDELVLLPDGYQTQIGDALRDLSGGQRQRLGIARALAGDPQLLVLDEPTSALDAVSESQVQRTLSELKGRATVVIIAHRLATLNHCDRLLVLESGRVQALDTPSAVMEKNEFYRRAAKMQLIDTDDAARTSAH